MTPKEKAAFHARQAEYEKEFVSKRVPLQVTKEDITPIWEKENKPLLVGDEVESTEGVCYLDSGFVVAIIDTESCLVFFANSKTMAKKHFNKLKYLP